MIIGLEIFHKDRWDLNNQVISIHKTDLRIQ